MCIILHSVVQFMHEIAYHCITLLFYLSFSTLQPKCERNCNSRYVARYGYWNFLVTSKIKIKSFLLMRAGRCSSWFHIVPCIFFTLLGVFIDVKRWKIFFTYNWNMMSRAKPSPSRLCPERWALWNQRDYMETLYKKESML